MVIRLGKKAWGLDHKQLFKVRLRYLESFLSTRRSRRAKQETDLI